MTSIKRSSLFRRIVPRRTKVRSADLGDDHSFETIGGVYQESKTSFDTTANNKVFFHGDIGKKLQAIEEDDSSVVSTEPTEALSLTSSFDASVDSTTNNGHGNPSTGMIPFQWTRQESQRNLFANMSFEEEEQDEQEEGNAWKSSGSATHHDDAPLITLRSESVRLIDPNLPELQLGDDEVLHKVLTKAAKHLPRHSGNFCSLHVMINAERVKHQVAPLQRMPCLDEMARDHAKAMAAAGKLQHANLDDLEDDNVSLQGSHRIGSNVGACGGDLCHLFQSQMKTMADCNNILDRRYTYMGVGTEKGSDGRLYVCQIFA